jgi:cyclic beta-1,2-glucan synthetase
VLRRFPDTLLDESCRAAIWRQMDYAAARGVPWGISESAYDAVDRNGTYQYKSFGTPGLGLKRGLGDELVVAPYATALAVGLEPAAAVLNLRRLEALGLDGEYGFLEAIDFTRRDPEAPATAGGAVVSAYMAHHQGMTLVAFANALLDDVMIERFHAEP